MAREYGTSVETTASPEKVWRVWSDMSTWGEWNPNVSTMDWEGGFASGTTGVMITKGGQHHKMELVDAQPGHASALSRTVFPGPRFPSNSRFDPPAAKTKIARTAKSAGRLGPLW